jgi:hypothetical protein
MVVNLPTQLVPVPAHEGLCSLAGHIDQHMDQAAGNARATVHFNINSLQHIYRNKPGLDGVCIAQVLQSGHQAIKTRCCMQQRSSMLLGELSGSKCILET